MAVWVGEGRAARESVAGVSEYENLEDSQQQKPQWVDGSGASCWFPQWCKQAWSSAEWCAGDCEEVLHGESCRCPQAPERVGEVLSNAGWYPLQRKTQGTAAPPTA